MMFSQACPWKDHLFEIEENLEGIYTYMYTCIYIERYYIHIYEDI
jgi:uncharacterized UPF0160 family protein